MKERAMRPQLPVWTRIRARFYRRVLSLTVLFLIILIAADTQAAPQLDIDKTFGKVSGWTIGFSNTAGGCLAAAKYKDETTLWMGFSSEENEAYIAFSNPKWKSIEPDSDYNLQLLMGRRRWNGNFTGFSRKDEKGVFASNLKAKFIEDLAGSGGVRVVLNRASISSLSLDGSRDALAAVISCQKEFVTASNRSGGGSPGKPQNKGGSSGTGFFVSANGYIITNQHVIEGCSTIKVVTPTAQESTATIVAKDKTNDLAILKTSLAPAAVPGIRRQPRLGEPVYVFGYPLTSYLSTSGNFTMGSVTSLSGMNDDTRMLQISAPVQPGNSGGPLIDKYGNVIGVIVSKLNAMSVAAATNDIPQNVNFAIRSNILLNFIETTSVSATDPSQGRELPAEAIADLAKLFSVRVTCN